MRFLRKDGAFSTFFRVMKRDGSGNAMRRFPGMPRKAVPDGGKMLCGERGEEEFVPPRFELKAYTV